METLEILIWLSAATITVGREECPLYWTRVNKQCFRVVSSLAYDTLGFPTVLHARKTCQQYGGDLAYIRDAYYEHEAYSILRSMPLDTVPRKIYIGLNDIRTDGHFEWLNGIATSYTDWAPAEPNNGHWGDEDCVVVKSPDKTWASSETEWHDYPCCGQHYITHALCYRDLNETEANTTIGYGRDMDVLYNKCNDVDECLSNPCLNGGRCVDDFLEYTCECLYGFKGTNCEQNVTCSLPNLRNATIGTLVRGEDLTEDRTLHSVLEVKCEPGFSFRETDNPVGKLFNCTVDGWKWVDTVVIKCKPLPTWAGLRSNDTVSRYPGSPLNYSCAEDMKFDDKSGDVFKFSICNDTGHWEPALENCTEIESTKAKFAKVKKPVEASGATVLGTFGLVFLITELVMFVFMDLNVYRTQLLIAYGNIKNWLNEQRKDAEFEAVPTQI